YRYRDFSPEGRRAARQPWQGEPADLDYRTQNRPPSAPPQQAPSAPPVTASVPPVAPPPEGTLSRRQLRALREQQQRAQQAPSVPPVAPPLYSAPPQYSAPPVTSVPPQHAAPPVASQQAPSWLAPFTNQPEQAPVPSAPPVVPVDTAGPTPPPLVEPQEPRTDAVASLEALFRAQSGAVPLAPEAPSAAPVAPAPEAGSWLPGPPTVDPAEPVLPP